MSEEPINHVEVGPHPFEPLNAWPRSSRCSRCYLPRSEHPVRGYVKARPLPGPNHWALYMPVAGALLLILLVALRACGPF